MARKNTGNSVKSLSSLGGVNGREAHPGFGRSQVPPEAPPSHKAHKPTKHGSTHLAGTGGGMGKTRSMGA